MSNPYDPHNRPEPPEMVDDLMIRDEGEEYQERTRVSSSVRDMASRIPESLSAIGRDISRTIERAIAAKDDYVVAVKVSPEAQDKLEQLVQAGVFRSRAEAAAYLIDEGIKTQSALFERVQQKLSEIERLRAELRGMVGEKTN
jgi:Arc/MetJ-type ribon-helix-helix transcriptional regulator